MCVCVDEVVSDFCPFLANFSQILWFVSKPALQHAIDPNSPIITLLALNPSWSSHEKRIDNETKRGQSNPSPNTRYAEGHRIYVAIRHAWCHCSLLQWLLSLSERGLHHDAAPR